MDKNVLLNIMTDYCLLLWFCYNNFLIFAAQPVFKQHSDRSGAWDYNLDDIMFWVNDTL